jgi:hypothetical protein
MFKHFLEVNYKQHAVKCDGQGLLYSVFTDKPNTSVTSCLTVGTTRVITNTCKGFLQDSPFCLAEPFEFVVLTSVITAHIALNRSSPPA